MPSAIRILVFIAAAGVIGAATHANVMHAGGYASRDAPLIIALAVLLALGMAFVGVCFNEGRRWQAILLAVLILAGETYWVLINADREVASLDAIAAPVAQMRADRSAAASRLRRAETAKTDADTAAISEAAKKDCASNCAKLLLAGQQQAELDLKQAREALARLPEPRSVTPLSDRLGIAPWAWDLVLAGLRSLGILGGSLAIGMVLHSRRPAAAGAVVANAQTEDTPRKLSAGRPRLIGSSTSIEILPPRPRNKREHVSLFLREVLKPDPSAQASLRSLHARYNDWRGDEKLPPAELGKELRAIINALGLKCEQSGRDVVVYGAAQRSEDTMSDYGPQVKLTRLYEKTSKAGNQYFVGRLGMAKVAVLKSKEVAEDGSPMWDVLLQEAPSEPRRKTEAKPETVQEAATSSSDAPAYLPKRLEDDAIPF
jgi:hypothetical protein